MIIRGYLFLSSAIYEIHDINLNTIIYK